MEQTNQILAKSNEYYAMKNQKCIAHGILNFPNGDAYRLFVFIRNPLLSISKKAQII